MSETMLQNRIADLDFWLTHNSQHANYNREYQKREELKRKLIIAQSNQE